MITLCSFAHAEEFAKGTRFSTARWQPKGCHYPSLWFLAPFRADGTPIKMMPPDDYRREYIQHVLFGPNRERINKWMEKLDAEEDITLLCWCHKERQSGYPKLMCHTELIGYLLRERRPDIEVVFADGRDKPVWTSLLD